MAAHARPPAGGVFAEPVPAEHVVLRTRHVGSGDAWARRSDPGLQCLAKDGESLSLRIARLAHDQRAANLDEITLDRRRELGGDKIAGSDCALRRRRHAQHFLAAGADDHEIIWTAAAAQIALDLGGHPVL